MYNITIKFGKNEVDIMSSAIKHKERSRYSHNKNREVFGSFERRSNVKTAMRDSRKGNSVLGGLLTKAKSLFRKNQGK